MKKDLIIGYGEIGKSIHECYNNKEKAIPYDLGYDESILVENKGDVRCMHICFGFFTEKQFIVSVLEYVSKIYPEMVIIHSTVPVGTTRKIYDIAKQFGARVAHSPVMGIHPHLQESIQTHFIKFYAALPKSRKSNSLVKDIFYEMNIDEFESFSKPEATELAKLFSTTRYAHHISIATEIKRYCDLYSVKFEEAYTNWEDNYNEGYCGMGKLHFVRPVLKPCKDKIGGHCITANIKIIKKYMKKTWLTEIMPKKLIR